MLLAETWLDRTANKALTANYNFIQFSRTNRKGMEVVGEGAVLFKNILKSLSFDN